MFEQQEFQKIFGENGKVTVDVMPDLKVKISLEITLDLVDGLRMLASKTATEADDTVLHWLATLVKTTEKAP